MTAAGGGRSGDADGSASGSGSASAAGSASVSGSASPTPLTPARLARLTPQEAPAHAEQIAAIAGMTPSAFALKVEDVVRRGRELYRDFPWRDTRDPYGILVSEVMLQQTQTARVERYWPAWVEAFPTAEALAAASVADVLERWQGLGYNRRALALKASCERASREGGFPADPAALVDFPGIGPATAAGVAAFAFDVPGVYLETNVRSVFIHEFFPGAEQVDDRDLKPLIALACPETDVRGHYYALLDLGAELKRRGENPSRRSKQHVRQSKFEGSRRQKRSVLLKELIARGSATREELTEVLVTSEREAGRDAPDAALTEALLDELVVEGFATECDGRLTIE